MSVVTEHRSAGCRVSVERWGDDGPTIVLVHGIGVSRRYFRPLAELLGASCRVLAVDLPGFGASPRPDEVLTVEQHAEVVAELLEGDGVTTAVLLGHSMGAQVVTEAAVTVPGLASSLVLIGPVIQPGHRRFPEQALRLVRDTPRERPGAVAIMLSDWLRCGPRRYFATVPSMLDYRLEDRLPELSIPVVLVRGEHDTVVPPDYLALLAGRAQDATTVEVSGAGHVAMYSHPEVVAAICRSAGW